MEWQWLFLLLVKPSGVPEKPSYDLWKTLDFDRQMDENINW